MFEDVKTGHWWEDMAKMASKKKEAGVKEGDLQLSSSPQVGLVQRQQAECPLPCLFSLVINLKSVMFFSLVYPEHF